MDTFIHIKKTFGFLLPFKDVKPADFEGDWNPIFQSVKGFSKDDIQQGGLGKISAIV